MYSIIIAELFAIVVLATLVLHTYHEFRTADV